MITSAYLSCVTERILVSCVFMESGANVTLTFCRTRMHVCMCSTGFLPTLLLSIRAEWIYSRCIRFVLADILECSHLSANQISKQCNASFSWNKINMHECNISCSVSIVLSAHMHFNAAHILYVVTSSISSVLFVFRSLVW